MTLTTTHKFSDLVRRRRVEAGLSQAELAERAGISVNAIGAYEQGWRSVPRRETVTVLVEALHLCDEARVEFEAAARQGRGATQIAESDTATNLPWQPTSFVGRNHELKEISALLSQRCLVTVTGAGGIGKTRTSLEVASRLARSPRDGVWFVDLAPLTDGSHILTKIASVLNVNLPEQDDLLAALIAAIKNRDLFLILDNCEHVTTTIRALVNAMLQACPRIMLLATSRERLGVAGELTYQLSSLTIPTNLLTTAIEARSYDALELFAERASASKHGFQFSDEHVEIIAEICRKLDGIALAIELAAARLPVLGLSELRAQLTNHFHVIGGARPDFPARQHTLSATISWSYDLLNESERLLFRRLAIFASGWTLEAAERVCADDSLEKTSVLDALFSLVEKSLVNVDLDIATPRYSFFESTRAFALEKLVASCEDKELSRHHAQWIAKLADRAYETYGITPRNRWEIAIAPELDNVFAALEWALGRDGDAIIAGRIASGLDGFWPTSGVGIYGRRYLSAAVERIDAQERPELMARLLLAQSRFLYGTARKDAMTRVISLLENADDARTLARCYAMLSYALAHTGQYSEAEEASNRSSVLLHEEGLQRSPIYSNFLNNRSMMFRMQNRLDEAKAILMESLALANTLADDWSRLQCQAILADIEFNAGNAPRAIELGEAALVSARSVRSAEQEVYSLCNLACYQLVIGEIDAADSNAREALDLARTSNPNTLAVHGAIQHLSTVASLKGDPLRAARLLGYMNAWYERIGCLRDPTEQQGYNVLLKSLRKQISDDEISVLAAQGAQLTEDAAIADALAEFI